MRMMILLSLFLFVSCQKSDDKVTSGTKVTSKEYTACTNNGSESSSVNYIFFSNGKYKTLVVYYDAINCADASAREMNFITGEYSYNAVTSKMTDRSYKLEIAYLTNAAVTNSNNLGFCDYNDWVKDVFKDATDRDNCDGGTISSSDPATVYDAILNDSVFDNGYTIFNRVH